MAIVRGVVVASAFVAEGPILGWLGSNRVLDDIIKQTLIPADSLAPSWPEQPCTPEQLRAEMKRRAEDGESIDPPWTGIVQAARPDGEHGRLWRLLACAMALQKLSEIAVRYHARHPAERCDIHADLIEGFLAALPTINLDRPHVARRLAEAARRRLRRAHKLRRNHIPAELDWLPHPSATPGTGAHNWTDALAEIADDFTAAGQVLDPIGLELIGRTVIDKQTLTDAAADLGLPVQAAYKRRSRAEQRIAAFYRITTRRPASGRSTTVSRGAREDAA